MPNALSTEGQGATSYIAIVNWAFSASANTTGNSKIEIEFKIISYRSAAFAYLLASSASTQNALRIDPSTGRLQYRAGGVNRIESVDGAVLIGQIYKARLEYNKATTTTSLFLNDVPVGTYVASNSVSFNQINRFSTNAGTYVDMVLYSMSTLSDDNFSTYRDSWPPETAPNTGTTWTSTGGTRNLTVTNFTGAADSWWLFYSAGVYVRAMLQKIGAMSQITDAELGTGKKPLVLLNGEIKERAASEGIPIVYDAGNLRTIAAGETLLL